MSETRTAFAVIKAVADAVRVWLAAIAQLRAAALGYAVGAGRPAA